MWRIARDIASLLFSMILTYPGRRQVSSDYQSDALLGSFRFGFHVDYGISPHAKTIVQLKRIKRPLA
jgi:hypothetical protein